MTDAGPKDQRHQLRFLIARFRPGAIRDPAPDLATAAARSGLPEVVQRLERFRLTGTRLITSVPLERLEELERAPFEGEPPAPSTLSSCWRLDTQDAPSPLSEIETGLRALPVIDQLFPEQPVSDPTDAPVDPSDDPLSLYQRYLDPAPVGVDARWVWTQPGGRGAGMQFVDLEHAWARHHDDLPPYELIFGDNQEGVGTVTGGHGAAVLGIVAGVDNARGIIGTAPRVTTRAASYWKAGVGDLHVADVLIAAVAAVPRPHVVLLEVQTEGYPIETDSVVRDAIRCAVANGVIVVEAGGNGGFDLDKWVDASGRQSLKRNTPHFVDSGAILVGAARADLPHDRVRSSNHGSRVDCYAWGTSITTAWEGPGAQAKYTRDFGLTSGASAIIAGAALLLQGLSWHSTGTLLRPLAMRALLSDPSTGTAQGTEIHGDIGVMPDLQRIVRKQRASRLSVHEQ